MCHFILSLAYNQTGPIYRAPSLGRVHISTGSAAARFSRQTDFHRVLGFCCRLSCLDRRDGGSHCKHKAQGRPSPLSPWIKAFPQRLFHCLLWPGAFLECRLTLHFQEWKQIFLFSFSLTSLKYLNINMSCFGVVYNLVAKKQFLLWIEWSRSSNY